MPIDTSRLATAADEFMQTLAAVAKDFGSLIVTIYFRWPSAPWRLMYQRRDQFRTLTPLLAIVIAVFFAGTLAVDPKTSIYAYFADLGKVFTPDLTILSALVRTLPTILVVLLLAAIGEKLTTRAGTAVPSGVFLYLAAAQVLVFFFILVLTLASIVFLQRKGLQSWYSLLPWIVRLFAGLSMSALFWFWIAAGTTIETSRPIEDRVQWTLCGIGISFFILSVALYLPFSIRDLCTAPEVPQPAATLPAPASPSAATSNPATTTGPTIAATKSATMPATTGPSRP